MFRIFCIWYPGNVNVTQREGGQILIDTSYIVDLNDYESPW